ncbi:BZ3500_MvSof-1268-A1-R1_Chr12-2g03924 [Microbotryum saponariae]|uniref:BZ3500_MvSof-1268-A1-R1_Chr12-2g03924 protein n=1 Tax=Microbotryum saponariae TaxID=289078 RepID=A0A2X0KNJ2_9BASI|nr:BZ3500_MvSof-1268-A1-R1_Chr12-2g03924 [Microbotryum saponariae]
MDRAICHLGIRVAAALGVGPAPQKYYRDHATQSSHKSGELLQKAALSKVITLEDDEDEDEMRMSLWRKKMGISTCRHVEVSLRQIRQFHVSDQIDLFRSDQDQITQGRIRKIQIRSDLIASAPRLRLRGCSSVSESCGVRTLARAMILWNRIQLFKTWVDSHVNADLGIEKWSIVVGASFAIGLKFAGTAAAQAHGTLNLLNCILSSVRTLRHRAAV